MAETLYEGPAHGAIFYLPTDGAVRFRFSNHVSGYVRSPTCALARVEPGTRLSLPRGQHTHLRPAFRFYSNQGFSWTGARRPSRARTSVYRR
jgi:hypothetical protein